MRVALALVVSAVFQTASPSAQTLYHRDGERGFGLFASAAPSANGTGLGASVVASVVPGVDVAAEYARIPDGYPDGSSLPTVKAGGASVAFYPVRTGPARVGFSLGIAHVTSNSSSRAVTAATFGLAVGHQAALAPGVTFAPNVAFLVPVALGDGGGAGFSGVVTPAVLVGSGSTRVAVAPSVGYGFDSRETTLAATLGLVTSL